MFLAASSAVWDIFFTNSSRQWFEGFQSHDITWRKPAVEKGKKLSWICTVKSRKVQVGATREWRNVRKRSQEEAWWQLSWISGVGGHLEKVTSRKKAAANDDDVTEASMMKASTISADWRRREIEASWQQLTSTMLDCSQISEKGYMRGTNRVLLGDGGLVQTQLGYQRQKLGSDPA